MKAQIQTSLFQVSEIKVSYQPKFKASERPLISSSKNAYDILIAGWDMHTIQMTESFKILILNRSNRIIGMKEISSGGISGTVADPKVIFAIALKCLGSAIICCHNHPSSNLKPSQQDISITKRLVEAGKILDLQVLDHLIISKDDYYSFGDEGLM
jgi:DNA repair protein RadC